MVDIYLFRRLVVAGSVDHCADCKLTNLSVCLWDCRVVCETVESYMCRNVGSLKVNHFDCCTVPFFAANTSLDGFVAPVRATHDSAVVQLATYRFDSVYSINFLYKSRLNSSDTFWKFICEYFHCGPRTGDI